MLKENRLSFYVNRDRKKEKRNRKMIFQIKEIKRNPESFPDFQV